MNSNTWPTRPPDECFPELMDGTTVAQFLGLDLRGMTPENGRRTVRTLARDQGLPRLRKVGKNWLHSKQAVWEWLRNGAGEVESGRQERSETPLVVSNLQPNRSARPAGTGDGRTATLIGG